MIYRDFSELPGDNTAHGFHLLDHGWERQREREGLGSENIALTLKQPDFTEKSSKQRTKYFRQFGERWLQVVAKVGQGGKGYPHVITAYWVNPGKAQQLNRQKKSSA